MTINHRLLVLVISSLSFPFVTGFVLLGIEKASLPVSPEAPEAEFLFDPTGDAPSISAKEEIENGAYTNLTDKEMLAVLIQIGMNQWNSVRGSYLQMKLTSSTSSLERKDDDKMNVIVAENNTNASTAAFATPRNNPDNSTEIYDCDISISMNSVTAQSLLETITHELGHCVGLGHPHNNYGAIMSYSRGGHSYRLSADDRAGIIYLYPDPNYVDSQPRELISCGNIGRHHRSSRILAVILLVIPMAFVIRRKRAHMSSRR